MKTTGYAALLLLSLLFFSRFIFSGSKPFIQPSLTKVWETDSILKTPESVYYHEGKNILYVANINGNSREKDGNGFISRLSLEGKIENLEWIKGLDAPKGLGVFKDMLYVADITNIKVIDTQIGEIVNTLEVPNASFLNDITIDSKGIVYVTDSDNKIIFRIEDNVVTEWISNPDFKRLNGLYATDEALYLADREAGFLYSIDYATRKLTKLSEGVPGADGIVMPNKKEFLVSNWSGEINYVSEKDGVIKLLDTKDQKINAADIEYVHKGKLLLVPTFFKNSVVAYEFKK